MKIMKFGGTSVANAEHIGKVVDIISTEHKTVSDLIVVVSALGGVTDQLIKLAKKAASGTEIQEDVIRLYEHHDQTLRSLVDPNDLEDISREVEERFRELSRKLEGIRLLEELSPRSMDSVLSFGERLSSIIIAKALSARLQNVEHIDSEKLIITDSRSHTPEVRYDESERRIKNALRDTTGILVMGGFIASNELGILTTLGRGGSDYTASIVGAALEADEIQIWTDVDGVLSADPRQVGNAFVQPAISYEEAAELAHFGAKVIHPKTMRPARLKKIPIQIKNTFRPEAPGTRIHADSVKSNADITGISSASDVTLLRIQSTYLKHLTEITRRIYDILDKHDIEVLLTTQASSEHALCIGLFSGDALQANLLIEKALSLEIEAGYINPINMEKDLSIIAIVGEHMKGVPGISGRFFDVLGRQGINIKAIAQGSSELNISAVIESKYIKRAMNAVHNAFFHNTQRSIHLFIVGVGLVGKRLLDLIRDSAEFHRKTLNLDIQIWGIANSRKMYFTEEAIPSDGVLNGLENGHAMHMHDFIREMVDRNLPNTVFVDCTASADIPRHYPGILRQRISIVTPNKKANSGTYAFYDQLKKLSRDYHVSFKYETNVGAALPVIKTIHQLHQCGDTIHELQAVLSGTLSYIFNTFAASDRTFGDIVRDAREKGYTEPDPRDDLNGMDVMRKILILARECGHKLEPEDVMVKPVLNEACANAPDLDTFFNELDKMNAVFEEMKQQAAEKETKWCYMATFANDQARVSLEEIGRDHPFYSLKGSDNIISIRTDRYADSPLVIRGHGAGADVTASGVLSDIIETLRSY